MKLFSFVSAGTAAVLLLAGCQLRPFSWGREESTKYSIENTERFARLDPAAQAAITCTGLQEKRNAAGRLEVVANLKNRQNTPIQVRVRCVFKDADGFTTGDATEWQSLLLADAATETVSFTAINPAARKYTILVRSAP